MFEGKDKEKMLEIKLTINLNEVHRSTGMGNISMSGTPESRVERNKASICLKE